MFFEERIISIHPQDRVLEIGPGATPHSRSDVLLELQYTSEEQRVAQYGSSNQLNTNKEIVYYDGKEFPFKDKQFDYVICSHVLEHVDDVESFLQEIQRVATKGYLEFPTIYYDYLFNFNVHVNVLFWNGKVIKWMKKSEINLNHFSLLQSFFKSALDQQCFKLDAHLKPYFFQGFEWSEDISFRRVKKLEDVTFEKFIKTGLQEVKKMPMTLRNKIKSKTISLILRYL